MNQDCFWLLQILKRHSLKPLIVNESDITINHVLASAAIPINYPYMEINEKKYWDGGILSNTPIKRTS